MCEFRGETGKFAAGALSNKIADKYMNQMIETELSMNLNEELNMEIFKLIAKEQQRDISTVLRTCTIRQNVHEYMQGDILDRPKNQRPAEWGDTVRLNEDDISTGSNILKPKGSTDGS